MPIPSISSLIHATNRTLLKGSGRLFRAALYVNQLDIRGTWRKSAKAKKIDLTPIMAGRWEPHRVVWSSDSSGQQVRSRRRGASSFLYAVSMLSRRATARVAPGKLNMIVLKSENDIVAVGQCTSGKGVTAKKIVFRSQAVQVNDVPDFHNPSVSQGGQSLSNTSLTTVLSADQ
jgi:hypothetical protein